MCFHCMKCCRLQTFTRFNIFFTWVNVLEDLFFSRKTFPSPGGLQRLQVIIWRPGQWQTSKGDIWDLCETFRKKAGIALYHESETSDAEFSYLNLKWIWSGCRSHIWGVLHCRVLYRHRNRWLTEYDCFKSPVCACSRQSWDWCMDPSLWHWCQQRYSDMRKSCIGEINTMIYLKNDVLFKIYKIYFIED